MLQIRGKRYCYTFKTLSLRNVCVIYFVPVLEPCEHYNALDETWRATNNLISLDPYYYYYNYWWSWGSARCDNDKYWSGWYRLMFQGNDIRVPESCVSPWGCGTRIPLWLNGAHPQKSEGVVTRLVCGSWTSSCCDYSVQVQVKACPGDYYVYEFVNPPVCPAAYCAGNGSAYDETESII